VKYKLRVVRNLSENFKLIKQFLEKESWSARVVFRQTQTLLFELFEKRIILYSLKWGRPTIFMVVSSFV